MTTLITLITEEGPVLHFKETLLYLSETIQNLLIDFPDVTELHVSITKRQLELALRFLSTLQPAHSKDEWKDMITGLEYLQIIPRYHKLLIEEVKNFLSASRIAYAHTISPIDALKKICDPNYKSQLEREQILREEKLMRIAGCNHKGCFLGCPQRDLENLGVIDLVDISH